MGQIFISRRFSTIILAVGASTASATQLYKVTDLGTFGGPTSVVYGINNAGQIVGSADTTVPNQSNAFLYSNGVLTDLDPTGNLSVSAINNKGDMLGFDGSNQVPVLIVNGSVTQISGMDSVFSFNDKDEIAGQVFKPDPRQFGNTTSHAIIREPDGSIHDLSPDPQPVNTSGYFARLINDSDFVAGGFGLLEPEAAFTTQYSPTVQSTGVSSQLGSFSYIYGLNSIDNVTGKMIESNFFPFHAFEATKSGSAIDIGALLPNPTVNQSEGNAINDSNQVVGDFINPLISNAVDHAFIYANGTATDLNTLIPFDPGWVLGDAVGINNSGLIVGTGLNPAGQERAFLLTPVVPEPGTLSMLVILTPALLRRRRAR